MERFGLIGKDLEYTQVQRVHAELGDYEYNLIEPEDDSELGIILSDPRFDGFNITHPYETEIIKYMDELSDDAKAAQSVNVVKRMPGGRLKGFNTYIRATLHLAGDSVRGKTCIVLGMDGPARSIARALSGAGAYDVIMVSDDPEADAGVYGRDYYITGYDRLHLHYDAEVIVNCTAEGRYPDIEKSPFTDHRISVRLFSHLELAIDLIYNPYRTKFLQDAKRLTGCRTKSGLDMLMMHAVASRNIWYDIEHDIEEEERIIRQVKRRILESQLNVVAVGLPGSGKTTIFRRYAYELGLRFIDTDEETEKLMGQKINDVLSSSGLGEEYFRASEHQAVRNLASVRGAVIATGGGTLLNPVNRDLLKANGIVMYVKRPLEMLDIKGRPLSINIDLTELFNDRDRIYRRSSDITLINSRIFGEKKAKTGEGNSYNYELKGFVYYMARKVQKYLNELAANEWT